MKKQLRIFKTRVRDTLDHKQLEKQDQRVYHKTNKS